MRRIRIIVVALLVSLWLVLEGCTGTPAPPLTPISETSPTAAPTQAPTSPPAETTPAPKPAEFEVTSLSFEPFTVMAGENVSVKAVIRNIGGSEGIYPVTLTLEGVKVETKEVTIEAGGSQTITFALSKDRPGTYNISVGNRSSSLLVKEKIIELKYDDGKADFSLRWNTQNMGYLVDFSPPSKPFIIKQVQLVGMTNGSIAIWNKDMKPLYESSYSSKAGTTPWREIDIPNVEVSDKFYIHFFSPSGVMSADNSTSNQHSYASENISGTFRVRYQWLFSFSGGSYLDQSNTNWMIRVYGTTK
ncbi:MAG: CARDB domain-containing protein [Chloroflexota bacterium]